MLKFLLPRLRDILFMAVFLGAILLGPRMLSLDSDLGRHLTLGRFILEQQTIPTTDILSHTKSGEARPPYEWMEQVAFAMAERAAGLDGVILLCALTITSAFTLLYMDGVRRSSMPLTALAIALIAVAASSLHWLPRPHVATFLFLTLWTERLERVRRGEYIPLWQFPALMLVWVNTHGGFVFGFLAWFAYLAGWVWEKNRKMETLPSGRFWLAIGAMSLLASVVTPSGLGNWEAVLSNNSGYILSRTVETMPPDFMQPGVWPFAFLLFVSFLLILATRKTFSATHFFLLAGFGLLALTMARNVPLFVITAAPILSQEIGKLLRRVKYWEQIESNIVALEKPLRGMVWSILLVLGVAMFIGNRYQVQKEALTHFNAQVFPIAAADWLAANPQSGNMFNEFNWGGYLLYRLWPEHKVFLDSQTDFYGEAFMREYEMIVTAQTDWVAKLARYNVKWVIAPPNSKLIQFLEQDTAWTTLYSDSTAVIMRRQ